MVGSSRLELHGSRAQRCAGCVCRGGGDASASEPGLGTRVRPIGATRQVSLGSFVLLLFLMGFSKEKQNKQNNSPHTCNKRTLHAAAGEKLTAQQHIEVAGQVLVS